MKIYENVLDIKRKKTEYRLSNVPIPDVEKKLFRVLSQITYRGHPLFPR